MSINSLHEMVKHAEQENMQKQAGMGSKVMEFSGDTGRNIESFLDLSSNTMESIGSPFRKMFGKGSDQIANDVRQRMRSSMKRFGDDSVPLDQQIKNDPRIDADGFDEYFKNSDKAQKAIEGAKAVENTQAGQRALGAGALGTGATAGGLGITEATGTTDIF